MRQMVLHDIRSHYNVGAIFRTADGAGFSKIYLSGLTPSPVDRFGRPVGEIHKTALGAEEVVPWEVVSDIHQLIVNAKADGFEVVAVEQSPGSVSLYDYKPAEKTMFIMGSETEGLPQAVIAEADVVLELPMRGAKESLNVSVTAGIVMYHYQ
jgi:23S rRNA (guanosine2251-2'-O)-methyltransferase